MKKALKVTTIVVVGAVLAFGMALATLHTVVELVEYYCYRYK